MRIFPKREHLHLPDRKEGSWDWLSIYGKDNKVMAHSDGYHPEDVIRLEYDGLEYVATPDGEIFITLKSIEAKFVPK